MSTVKVLCGSCSQPLDLKELPVALAPCGHALHQHCLRELQLLPDTATVRCPTCNRRARGLRTAAGLLDEGLQAFENGEYGTCRRKMLEVLLLDGGHAEANLVLGKLHAQGFGVPTDLQQAMLYWARAEERFREAHRTGDVQAILNLGWILLHRWELNAATSCFLQAHKEGHVEATYNLGVLHLLKGEAEEAQRLLLEAHRGGFPEASFNLGMLQLGQEELERWKAQLQAHVTGSCPATLQWGQQPSPEEKGEEKAQGPAEALAEDAPRTGSQEQERSVTDPGPPPPPSPPSSNPAGAAGRRDTPHRKESGESPAGPVPFRRAKTLIYEMGPKGPIRRLRLTHAEEVPERARMRVPGARPFSKGSPRRIRLRPECPTERLGPS